MHKFHYALREAGASCFDIFLLLGNDVIVVGMFSSWGHSKIAVLPGTGDRQLSRIDGIIKKTHIYKIGEIASCLLDKEKRFFQMRKYQVFKKEMNFWRKTKGSS